jgi:formylglycine-generating enzyme required for sulfatase activity
VAPLLNADIESAQAHVEDEELHSGVLVSRTDREVEFWHPTFGEYLAALELAFEPDYWDRIRPRLFNARWNEVVLLLAGCRAGHGVKYAADFIRKVLASMIELPDRALAVGLVGRILRDIQPYGGTPAQGTGYAEALQQVLAIFEKGKTQVAEAVRVEVGEALGQAGDPRLNDADDHADRVFISGGSFWMGAQSRASNKPGYDKECEDDEAPVHHVTLSSFHIDRYLVTVGRFKRFVEAGQEGYLAVRYWNPVGWEWRASQERDAPSSWEEQLRHPNWPVTGVSRYEADAYCRWRSAREERDVRLPTEAQWEFAARGEKGRKYPWGDEAPTDQHANFDMRVGHATPAGIYPLGSTPEGVHDLAGNVWEWCADWFGDYPKTEQTDPPGPPQGEFRLLRGGGFDLDPKYLRAAYRVVNHPASEDGGIGFRCVVVGTGGPAK